MDTIKERFAQLQSGKTNGQLKPMVQSAIESFNRQGVPTVRHEEWKYTRISSFFNKEFTLDNTVAIQEIDLSGVRLPGYETANEIVFVNGLYSPSLSSVRSKNLTLLSLTEAAEGEYAELVSNNLNHSSKYLKDGIQALNTAFVQQGIFLHIKKGTILEHPIYIYHITDARQHNIFAQPRSLFYISENAQVQIVENHSTLGNSESFSNGVMEIVVEKDAMLEVYKIQNDSATSSQVSTIDIRQSGKSFVHTVTITLNGGIIRNNLNIAMESDHTEAHLYGLYFVKGNTHVDNHTIVDNIKPHCLSNEFYKGIMDDHSNAVFNGKIYVQPDAQKINAFQSNKNILLSDTSSVNTKPQLEIFADDVKCSHGCTVGQLDEEGLFYLRSRGVSEKVARSLLVHAFAIDILDHIKPAPIRDYVDQLISQRLEIDSE